jgi:hypothetical protein
VRLRFVNLVSSVGDGSNFPIKPLEVCVFLLAVKTGTAKVFAFNRVIGSGKAFIA